MKLLLFKGKKTYYTLISYIANSDAKEKVTIGVNVYFDKKAIEDGDITISKDATTKLNKKGGFIIFEIVKGSLERSANGMSYFKVFKGCDVTQTSQAPKKENKKLEEVDTKDLPF